MQNGNIIDTILSAKINKLRVDPCGENMLLFDGGCYFGNAMHRHFSNDQQVVINCLQIYKTKSLFFQDMTVSISTMYINGKFKAYCIVLTDISREEINQVEYMLL